MQRAKRASYANCFQSVTLRLARITLAATFFAGNNPFVLIGKAHGNRSYFHATKPSVDEPGEVVQRQEQDHF